LSEAVPELRQCFDGVAELYDRIRPRYPAALFAELFSRIPAHPDVIEVGPGTGQATRSLLERGARVTAVELGPHLAKLLRRNLGSRQDLEIIVSSFETVDLPRHSFDAVVAATAYHWVTAPDNLERPSELLRPGGWLTLIDTVHVAAATDHGFFERVQPIYDRYGKTEGYLPPPAPDHATNQLLTGLERSALYEKTALFRYRWDQTYETADFADLLRSYSTSQAMEADAREALITEISACIDGEFNGRVTRPLVITLTMARTRL
jgi:SAM-dependent methyltransferase